MSHLVAFCRIGLGRSLERRRIEGWVWLRLFVESDRGVVVECGFLSGNTGLVALFGNTRVLAVEFCGAWKEAEVKSGFDLRRRAAAGEGVGSWVKWRV